MPPWTSDSHWSSPTSPTSTSRSLLVRVRSNDREAWDRLVRLYAPLVLVWCRRWGLQDVDAADVFQDVFQSVAAKIGTFRKENSADSFRGWLRVVTRNKVYDHFRRTTHEPHAIGGTEAHVHLAQLPAETAGGDEGPVEPGETDVLFRRALELIREQFEDRTWRAFWRTAVDGQTPKDVADELAMSPGAVRVAKSRVLHRLREELGDAME